MSALRPEVAALRQKEDRLRQEKDRLRQEKSELRQEKSELRQKENLLRRESMRSISQGGACTCQQRLRCLARSLEAAWHRLAACARVPAGV